MNSKSSKNDWLSQIEPLIVQELIRMLSNQNKVDDVLRDVWSRNPKRSSTWSETTDTPSTQENKPMANVQTGKFSRSTEIFTCPGCREIVFGRVVYEMTPTDAVSVAESDGTQEIIFRAKVLGLDVRHDCMPKTTR